MHEPAKPILVLMAGLPGAGKTTLALRLSRALGWPLLDKDTFKSGLLTAGFSEEASSTTSYALLFDLAYDLFVQQRFSIIVDTPGRYPLIIERGRALAQAAGGTLKIILCQATMELRAQRLAQRDKRPSQVTPHAAWGYDDRTSFGHLPPETLRLDATRPVGALMEEALAYLRG